MLKYALFGGSFDPIHIGHLRVALELGECLHADQVRFIPCASPPHKTAPLTEEHHRLAMLNLAIEGNPKLTVDTCEFDREGHSYTIDTLRLLRGQLGRDAQLFWCMGADGLQQLNTWNRWQQLTEFAHVVVTARPNWNNKLPREVSEWLSQRKVENIAWCQNLPAGKVLLKSTRQLPVSSTELRTKVAKGESIDYLTPPQVVDYIHTHKLYRQI